MLKPWTMLKSAGPLFRDTPRNIFKATKKSVQEWGDINGYNCTATVTLGRCYASVLVLGKLQRLALP